MSAPWSLTEVGLTHKLIDAYLENSEEIKDFIAHQPNLEGIKNSAKARQASKHQTNREALVKELTSSFTKFDDGSPKFEKTKNNIASLSNSNIFTVTTGQQLHLFLGPAYFLNKIFTCIKLVQNFNKSQTEYKTVPVFWLASEDHDTEEIESVELFGSSYNCNLTKNQITGTQNTAQIKELVESLEERLGEEAENHSLFNLCKEAYSKYESLADATSYIIYSLFSEYGIVIIDANNASLKKQINHIAKNEIETETSTQLQLEVKQYFDKQKWHYQVMPRGTNFFRIEKDNERTLVQHNSYESNANYSPNALLRPLYQEVILPNIAYVGGMAETSYWLQLKPIFTSYNIPFPVIWNRDTIHITNSKKAQQLLSSQYTISEMVNFKEDIFKEQYAKDYLPIHLQGLLSKLDEEINTINQDLNTKNWQSIKKDYALLQNQIKRELRSLKTSVVESKNYQIALKNISKLQKMYFTKAYLQERSQSNLSLTSNFKQFKVLKEDYLVAPLHHSSYYLLEI